MQIGGDMEDLESALTGKSTLKGAIGSGSCSSLIKVKYFRLQEKRKFAYRENVSSLC